MILKGLASENCKAFPSYDIERLQVIFSEAVFSRDGEIEARGLVAVIEASRQIFNSTKYICVTLLNRVSGEKPYLLTIA